MTRNMLEAANTGLLIIDVQDKLFPLVERGDEVLITIQLLVECAKLLELPIAVSEQYPEGLGGTIKALEAVLPEGCQRWSKTAFSCLNDEVIREQLANHDARQWLVVGIEAHVCVLQTVRQMVKAGLEPVVINDAISSRSLYDYSSAIAEMRDEGIRLASAETVIFELLRDAKHPQFKAVSRLLK